MTATILESKFILLMSNLFNIRLNSFRFYAADSLLDKTLANAWVPEDNFIFLYRGDILQSAVCLFLVEGYKSLDDLISNDIRARTSHVSIATTCSYLSQALSCVLRVFCQWQFLLIL